MACLIRRFFRALTASCRTSGPCCKASATSLSSKPTRKWFLQYSSVRLNSRLCSVVRPDSKYHRIVVWAQVIIECREILSEGLISTDCKSKPELVSAENVNSCWDWTESDNQIEDLCHTTFILFYFWKLGPRNVSTQETRKRENLFYCKVYSKLAYFGALVIHKDHFF